MDRFVGLGGILLRDGGKRQGRGFLVLDGRRSVASGENNGKRGARRETQRHENDLQPGERFSRGKRVFTVALDTPKRDPTAYVCAVLR
jgi:hypothetical protein